MAEIIASDFLKTAIGIMQQVDEMSIGEAKEQGFEFGFKPNCEATVKGKRYSDLVRLVEAINCDNTLGLSNHMDLRAFLSRLEHNHDTLINQDVDQRDDGIGISYRLVYVAQMRVILRVNIEEVCNHTQRRSGTQYSIDIRN